MINMMIEKKKTFFFLQFTVASSKKSNQAGINIKAGSKVCDKECISHREKKKKKENLEENKERGFKKGVSKFWIKILIPVRIFKDHLILIIY